ncbi:hypothetical protein MHY1_p00009 (plasmid) [Methylovirgula sp. HY1]|nr:hypothetical protein MHY1_p00009 [Methylovirgula sp. HY1]
MPPPRSSARRSRPHRAFARQGSNAGAAGYTTRFENAHGTELRELLYPWHPWFALQVAIHEAVEKVDGVVFRCTLNGSGADRWLEVPAWMFERASCPDHARLTATPFIDMTALSALADLLRQVLKDWAASSNAPLSGASESSHDQNRREAHVSIAVSAAVSQHEGTPKVARRSSKRTAAADRPVRRRTAERLDGCTGVARTAGGDTSHADQPDDAVDPGARSGKQGRISNGGQL